jgi:hypothetical protein
MLSLPLFQLVCTLCQGPILPASPATLTPLVVQASQPFGPVPASSASSLTRAPLPSGTGSVGTSIQLQGARELKLNLTPSPSRCAPLFELLF